jgi:hypothetical protein
MLRQGGLAKMLYYEKLYGNDDDGRRLGDKGDNPHGVTTSGAFQRKNLINSRHAGDGGFRAVMTHQILGKQSRSIQGETTEKVPRRMRN